MKQDTDEKKMQERKRGRWIKIQRSKCGGVEDFKLSVHSVIM